MEMIIYLILTVLAVPPIITIVVVSSKTGRIKRETTETFRRLSEDLFRLKNQVAQLEAILKDPQAAKQAPSVEQQAWQTVDALKDPQAATPAPSVEQPAWQLVDAPKTVEQPIAVAAAVTEPVIEPVTVEQPPTAYVPQPERAGERPPVRPRAKTDFEKFFGINLLSKIGIATLVLGLSYFVKYAIDRDWINEVGRVAIGVLCGGGLIVIAHRLRERYRTFSSILVGGGLSVLYITVTIAFRDYKLMTQPVAFVVLAALTAVSVLLSLWYNRKELAIFSLLGGFVAPLLVSSGAGNYIVLFSYLLILNAGMLVIAYKKQWRLVGLIAFVLTHLFLWLWLTERFESERLGGTVFTLLFYVQFYLMALIDCRYVKKDVQVFYLLIILSNNLLVYGALLFLYNDFYLPVSGVITVLMGAMNAVPLLALVRNKAIDARVVYFLIGVISGFLTLAIPVWLKGNAITMCWAVEGAILLWLWQRSRIRLFEVGFFVVELLALISLLMDWEKYYWSNTYEYALELRGLHFLPAFYSRAFITGLFTVASLWVNAYLLRRSSAGLSEGYKTVGRWFSCAATVLLFVVLLLELICQLEHRLSDYGTVRAAVYSLYLYIYVAVLTFATRRSKIAGKWLYWCAFAIVTAEALRYLYTANQIKSEILHSGHSLSGCLSILGLSALCIGYFFAVLWRRRKTAMYWTVCAASIVIISASADQLALAGWYDGENAYQLLRLTHYVVYPVLWGLAAFVLMIAGLKRKERALRMLSLSLIGLIIAKLYLHDVWMMEQAGRIVALVFLGILLLIVSFLYQKLKSVLKKEEDAKEELLND